MVPIEKIQFLNSSNQQQAVAEKKASYQILTSLLNPMDQFHSLDQETAQ